MADRERVVIVGGGFAGFHAARRLARLARGAIDIVLVNPTDYFLYLPLLPEVAAGILDPRRVAVSLASQLPGVRLAAGRAQTRSTSAGRRITTPTPRATTATWPTTAWSSPSAA